MIRIEPHLETIEQTAKRAISIADFANEPVLARIEGIAGFSRFQRS